MNHIARRWRYVPAFPQVKGLTFKISLYERLAICHTHRRCFIFIVAIIVRFYICEEFGTEIFRIKHVKEVEDFLADIVRIRNLKGFIAKCENKRRVFVVGLCQFNVANKLVYVLHHTLARSILGSRLRPSRVFLRVSLAICLFLLEASTAVSTLEFAFQCCVFGDFVCSCRSSFLTEGLSCFEGCSVDDSRMAVFNVVGIYLTVVFHSLEGKGFGSVAFSVHLITNVFFVLEDIEYASLFMTVIASGFFISEPSLANILLNETPIETVSLQTRCTVSCGCFQDSIFNLLLCLPKRKLPWATFSTTLCRG